MADESFFPPPAFAFSVAVIPDDDKVPAATDAVFQEISGLDPKMDALENEEGGHNRFVHRLPGVATHPNLVLKRGLVTIGSELAKWSEATIGSTLGTPITTRTITIVLVGPDGKSLMTWTVLDAWPVKWEVGSLDAANATRIITEKLELSYRSLTRA